MRNISQFAVSMVLLASQVQIPFTGDLAATASTNASGSGVYEVKLNTNTASAIEVVGTKKADYDAEVLEPLHKAQADAAAKAEIARKAAVKARSRRTIVHVVPTVLVAGSHTDWMREAGISESDFGYVDYIINRESGWGVTKSNYSGSGAYGLGQALPASKMAPFGADYLTNPITQLRWANAYAVGRYGSWANAYNFWINRHVW